MNTRIPNTYFNFRNFRDINGVFPIKRNENPKSYSKTDTQANNCKPMTKKRKSANRKKYNHINKESIILKLYLILVNFK